MQTITKSVKVKPITTNKKRSYAYKNNEELNKILDKSEKSYKNGQNKALSFNRAYQKVLRILDKYTY